MRRCRSAGRQPHGSRNSHPASRRGSAAAAAAALEQHFGDGADGRPTSRVAPPGCSGRRCRRRGDRHPHIVEARHLAAGGAQEVRVTAVVAAVSVMPADLESPDVITNLDAIEQPGLGQLREVSVDRGAVEAPARQGREHVRVSPGPLGRLEVLEHGQSGRRAPQAGSANSRSAGLSVGSSWTRHGVSLPGAGPIPGEPIPNTTPTGGFRHRGSRAAEATSTGIFPVDLTPSGMPLDSRHRHATFTPRPIGRGLRTNDHNILR